MKLTRRLKKVLLMVGISTIIGGAVTGAVKIATHKSSISLQDQQIKSVDKALKDSGSYEWDEILSMQKQIENQQKVCYKAAHTDWDDEQIQTQMDEDNSPFYDIYYLPTNLDENLKKACYDYVITFANENNYTVTPCKLMQSIKTQIVQQVKKNNPNLDDEEIDRNFDDLMESVSKNNIDSKTYVQNQFWNNIGTADKDEKDTLIEENVNSEFNNGKIDEVTNYAWDSKEVNDFMINNSAPKQTKPDDLVVDSTDFSHLFTFDWSDPKGTYYRITHYNSDIYFAPFLTYFNVKTSIRLVTQEDNGQYYWVKKNWSNFTNDMKVAFTFTTDTGHSFEITKDLTFNFTTDEVDSFFNDFKQKHDDYKYAQLVCEWYNPLFPAEINEHMAPAAKGFDKQDAIDNDEWYKENGHATVFPFAVGDTIPDDLAHALFNIVYGVDDFSFIKPGYSWKDGSWNYQSHSLFESKIHFQNEGLPEGKFIAKVADLGLGTDHPYATFDTYYEIQSPAGPIDELVSSDRDYRTYFGQEQYVTPINFSGAYFDTSLFELYFNADEIQYLKNADKFSTTGIKTLNYFDKIGNLPKDEMDEGLAPIETYDDWGTAYGVAQGAVGSALLIISACEFTAAAALACSGSFLAAALMFVAAGLDTDSAYDAFNESVVVFNNISDLKALSRGMYEFHENWAKIDGIEGQLDELRDECDRYTNSKSFKEKMDNAKALAKISSLIANETDDIIKKLSDVLIDTNAGDGDDFPTLDTLFFVDSVLALSGLLCMQLATIACVIFQIITDTSARGAGEDSGEAMEIFLEFIDELRDNEEICSMILKLCVNSSLKECEDDENELEDIGENAEKKEEEAAEDLVEEGGLAEFVENLSLASMIVYLIESGITLAWDFLGDMLAKEVMDGIAGLTNH